MDASLGASIETHDGRTLTFGPQEGIERLPTRLSFGTQIPGGYGQGSLVVPRPDEFDVLEAPLLAGARFYGPGNRTVYAGRTAAKPHIGVNEIELELEGRSAELDDDVFRYLYATRDLSKWTAPGLRRQAELIDPHDSPHQADAQVGLDADGALLRLEVTGAWDAALIPRCEAWRDAGSGLSIRIVKGIFDGWPDDDWVLTVNGSVDSHGGSPSDAGSDLYTDPSGEGTISVTFTQAFRYAWIEWHHNGTGGTENFPFGVNVRNLGAYGNHGLTLHATADSGAQGVRGDDVLRHALATACPNLPIDYIEASAFVIPELVFDAWDSRVRNVVEQVTLLGGATAAVNDWGVYENGFFWRAPGSYGITHRLRLDEGVEPVDEGEDSAEIATAIIATYTDATGESKAVGYPGSGADTESEVLIDTDPLNPIALSAVERKVITKEVGRTTPEGAILLAQLALAEATRTTRTGSYKVPALQNDEPAYYLRAGDRVLVEDHYPREQTVVQTEYSHDTGMVEVTVGAPANKLEVRLAQLAA